MTNMRIWRWIKRDQIQRKSRLINTHHEISHEKPVDLRGQVNESEGAEVQLHLQSQHDAEYRIEEMRCLNFLLEIARRLSHTSTMVISLSCTPRFMDE